MINILSNRTYRHLFMAQVIALIGTGLATVALGLLAYDLAGDRAGAVLGTALAIKMSAYILVAPVAAAFADKFPRRTMLVTLDLVRALVAISLPFVTQIWEIYILIFILQSASAAFTPTFQATIPDILPDEREYTRALSLSRLAYDLESVISPMLAAALLTGPGRLWFLTAFHRHRAGLLWCGVHGVSPDSPKTPRQNERPHTDACGDCAFSRWPGAGHFPEGLHYAGCALGDAGRGLFAFSDAQWSPAAPFVNS